MMILLKFIIFYKSLHILLLLSILRSIYLDCIMHGYLYINSYLYLKCIRHKQLHTKNPPCIHCMTDYSLIICRSFNLSSTLKSQLSTQHKFFEPWKCELQMSILRCNKHPLFISPFPTASCSSQEACADHQSLL